MYFSVTVCTRRREDECIGPLSCLGMTRHISDVDWLTRFSLVEGDSLALRACYLVQTVSHTVTTTNLQCRRTFEVISFKTPSFFVRITTNCNRANAYIPTMDWDSPIQADPELCPKEELAASIQKYYEALHYHLGQSCINTKACPEM